jgi:very-short-patch-repair endonuclease
LIGQTNEKILSNKLQRALRTNMTNAEQVLWKALRGRQFSGYKFRRQHPFSNYILDFVCLEIKLVIEVDGGQHCSHTKYDEIRTQRLQTFGFHVLRFWNNEVIIEIEAVKEKIWMTIQEQLPEHLPHPHPDPPLEREGEIQERFCLS